MARPAKMQATGAARLVKVEILRDGVFIAADDRKDRGGMALIDSTTAEMLIERGLARVV